MELNSLYSSPIGVLKIVTEDHYLKRIDFVYDMKFNEDIKKDYKNKFVINVFKQLDEYFAGKRKTFDIDLKLEGTDFQKCVWNELMKIPYGQIATYKDVAKSIDNPNAVRAVGNANNKNKIPIVIPCHRVVGSNLRLVGYAGGLNVKKYLLKLEKFKQLNEYS